LEYRTTEGALGLTKTVHQPEFFTVDDARRSSLCYFDTWVSKDFADPKILRYIAIIKGRCDTRSDEKLSLCSMIVTFDLLPLSRFASVRAWGSLYAPILAVLS
jgi:hypothetical protein